MVFARGVGDGSGEEFLGLGDVEADLEAVFEGGFFEGVFVAGDEVDGFFDVCGDAGELGGGDFGGGDDFEWSVGGARRVGFLEFGEFGLDGFDAAGALAEGGACLFVGEGGFKVCDVLGSAGHGGEATGGVFKAGIDEPGGGF